MASLSLAEQSSGAAHADRELALSPWRPELNSKATLSRLLPLIAASWAIAGGAEEAQH